jgi:hypothetical protein
LHRDTEELLFTQEVMTVCVDAKIKDYNSVEEMTACSIRENIRIGIAQLSVLDIDGKN